MGTKEKESATTGCHFMFNLFPKSNGIVFHRHRFGLPGATHAHARSFNRCGWIISDKFRTPKKNQTPKEKPRKTLHYV